jgi:hypothetical protein
MEFVVSTIAASPAGVVTVTARAGSGTSKDAPRDNNVAVAIRPILGMETSFNSWLNLARESTFATLDKFRRIF